MLLGGSTCFVIMPDTPPLLLGRRFLFVLYSLQKYARVWCGRRGSFCLRFGLRLTIMRPLWYGEGRRRRSERNCEDTRRLRLLLCLPPTCGYSYACTALSRCPRQRYNDTRPRTYIYFLHYFKNRLSFQTDSWCKKTATGAKKRPTRRRAHIAVLLLLYRRAAVGAHGVIRRIDEFCSAVRTLRRVFLFAHRSVFV